MMAQVIDQPTSKPKDYPVQPTTAVEPEAVHHHRVTDDDDSDDKTFFSWPPSTGLIIVVVFLAGLGILGAMVGKSLLGTEPATSTQVAASQSAAGQTTPAGSALTAAEQKEIAARDAYTVTIANELHSKVPAYKNVKIFADNWAGAKSPSRTPQTDPKTRAGDNLMLVFSSPEAGTAKGLADFAKSKAAQEAANAGFAELQFVDPDRYCYALIAPVTGVGAVQCGPR
jgi:hypothetical protein